MAESGGNLSGELTGTLGIGDFTLAQSTVAVSASATDPGVIHLEGDGGFDIGFLESIMHGEVNLNVLTGEFDYSFSGTALGVSVPGFNLLDVEVALDNDGFEAMAFVAGNEVGGVTRGGCLQLLGADLPLLDGSCGPEFSINNVTRTEEDPGQFLVRNFNFEVTMSRPLGILESSFVTIPITVETDTSVEESRRASANADFNLLPSPIIVQFSRDDGVLNKTVTVTVQRDFDVEEDERFRVVLGTPSYGVIADGVGIGTIVNDDFPPPDSTMLVGLDGSQQQTFVGTTRGGTISAAIVFLDANGNRLRDFLDLNGNGIQDTGEPGEPRSTTNAEGHVTFFVPKQFDRNGDGGVDFTEGTLVSTGGVDLGSLLSQATPFTAPAGSRIITPLTSLGTSLFERHGVRPIAASELIIDFFQLPPVQVYEFDHVAETLGGNLDGPPVAAAAVQINSTAIQIARLINGAASVPVDLAALSVFDKIADEVLNPAEPNGLDDDATIARLVRNAAAAFSVTLSDEAITAVATVIAEGNRRVAAVPKVANGDYLRQIKSVQVVGLTETAMDIEQAGAGTLTPADLVTRNTGTRLDEMIQVAKPGPIEAPAVSIIDAVLPISATGAATHQFVIRLAAPAALPVTVSFGTLVPSDSGLRVVEVAGTLVLEPGETEKPIPVGVDMKAVSGVDDEYFVRLTSARHATIEQSVARGIFDGPAEIQAVTLSQDLLAGEFAIIEAVFTDLAVQQHTATVDWGDGSQQEATIIQVGGQRTLNASHAYSRAGDYTVRLDVVDSTSTAMVVSLL